MIHEDYGEKIEEFERVLGEAKESLNRLQDEILEYGYASAGTFAKEKEEREVKEPRKR